MNQNKVNSLFMQVQRASLLANGILLFYSEVNAKRLTRHVYLDFAFVGDSSF